jgi:hypothetical protein
LALANQHMGIRSAPWDDMHPLFYYTVAHSEPRKVRQLPVITLQTEESHSESMFRNAFEVSCLNCTCLGTLLDTLIR